MFCHVVFNSRSIAPSLVRNMHNLVQTRGKRYLYHHTTDLHSVVLVKYEQALTQTREVDQHLG